MARAQSYWFLGDLVTVHVAGAETGGRLCVVELLQPAGEWTPLHVHRSASQTEYVLEGELTVYHPGRSTVLGPGECIHNPAGIPRTECVTSDGPARVLDVSVPAGFDEFVIAAGEPATEQRLPAAGSPEPDFDRLAALAADLADIELLGEPGALPSS